MSKSFDVFDKTAESFLDKKPIEYKSAKGRVSTDGAHFYSYRMPVAAHRADGVIEILHDGRAPTPTTVTHLHELACVLRRVDQKSEVVYTLDAPLCAKCGGRHGAGDYPGFYREESDFYTGGFRGRGDRKTFASGEAVCALRLRLAQADAEAAKLTVKVKRRGFVHAPLKYVAAVRDAGLPYLTGPAYVCSWATDERTVARDGLWVAPNIVSILEIKIPHVLKRKLLVRMVADATFREAMETLALSPGAAKAFVENYAAVHVEG